MTDSQPLASSTIKIKRVGYLLATRAIWRIQLGAKLHDQPIDWIRPLLPVRAEVECCKVMRPLWLPGHRLLSHQDPVHKHYKLPSMSNRWSCQSGVLPLFRGAVSIFHSPQLTGQMVIHQIIAVVFVNWYKFSGPPDDFNQNLFPTKLLIHCTMCPYQTSCKFNPNYR